VSKSLQGFRPLLPTHLYHESTCRLLSSTSIIAILCRSAWKLILILPSHGMYKAESACVVMFQLLQRRVAGYYCAVVACCLCTMLAMTQSACWKTWQLQRSQKMTNGDVNCICISVLAVTLLSCSSLQTRQGKNRRAKILKCERRVMVLSTCFHTIWNSTTCWRVLMLITRFVSIV